VRPVHFAILFAADAVGNPRPKPAAFLRSAGRPLVNGPPPVDLKGEQLLRVEILWDEIMEQGIVSRTMTQQRRIQVKQDPAGAVVNSVVAPWFSL